MFIQMGSTFVLMSRIESVAVIDDWLRVRTFSGNTYSRPCNKLEKNKTLANLLEKLCEIQGGNNETDNRHGQDGECPECCKHGEEEGVPVPETP
jgi:hypothetical protein